MTGSEEILHYKQQVDHKHMGVPVCKPTVTLPVELSVITVPTADNDERKHFSTGEETIYGNVLIAAQ